MITDQQHQTIIEVLLPHNPKRIGIFGSYARNEETRESDLDKEGFVNNKLVQDATIRNLEIIGEAAKNLSPEYRKENPEVDWKGMAGMRDKLIHHYMGVDIPSVWGVIVEVLPILNQKISVLLNEF